MVYQNPGDRNFHVFYQLFQPSGLVDESTRRSRLGLPLLANSYRFLNQGSATYAASINDSASAVATRRAMRQLGFGEDELGWVAECLAACVLIGEMKFNERQGYDQSFVEDMAGLERVASLLGLASMRLMDALTQPSIRIGDGSVIKKSQSLKKTLFSAAAFAKVVYERLFGWVVEKCNAAIEAESRKIKGGHGDGRSRVEDEGCADFVGVLDMAGFEIMTVGGVGIECTTHKDKQRQLAVNNVRTHLVKLDTRPYWPIQGRECTNLSTQ